ncbi:hypothetical protein NMG60_11027686 [Bertholletia excelsa]
MRRRSTRKSSAADLLVSPPPAVSPNQSPSASPDQFSFNIGVLNSAASSLKNTTKGNKSTNAVASSSSMLFQSPQNLRMVSTISELKETATSRLESIRRQLDCSHNEILKDIESSQSRLHKRLKIQTLACQQVMDEAQKEYKKISDQISETREAMKASYMEILAEAQASASRVCKTSIPELSHSFEKALDILRSRYGIPSTGV